jgi:DNA polymerase-3 subunit gamma/tau
MPYVVLARRWRPQLFKEVVGQEHVTKTLQNAISADRIAHAYLFSGPRGVGKTTVARILAKAVNCKEGPQPEPCEKCTTCTEISSGRSIDVIEIDAASNRGIDEIRELRESVKFTPVSGRYKVYIIDEAHMLTIEAFNALLKTLEEPPGHVIFILATTEPHKIPATILSRCQRFDFRMLTRKEITDRLRGLVKADNLSVDDEALSLIAESADGAMRDAESILDQLLSFGGGEIQTEEVSNLLGLGAHHLLDQLVGNILQSDAAESLKSLNVLADHGADLNQCLKKLVGYFRDLMVYKINPDLIDASETRLQQLAEQSKGVSIDRLMRIARILAQTESDIKQLGYERLNLELALVKLSRLREDAIPLDKVLSKLEEIESKFAAGVVMPTAVVAESEPVYNEAAASIQTQDEMAEHEESDPLRATWSRLLRAIKEKHPPALHAFLKEASPVSISDDSLAIDFGPRFNWHREQVEEAENKKATEAELSELMGKPMNLKITATDSSQSAEHSRQKTPGSQRDMRRDATQDESVRLVLDVFNGRVVEVK